MKICIITGLFAPFILGGTEVYTEKLSKKLVEAGYEVIVITSCLFNGIKSMRPSCEFQYGMKIYKFYPLNIKSRAKLNSSSKILNCAWLLFDFWNLHSYLVIKKILRKEKPSVVHTHNIEALSVSIFNAVKAAKIPLIHTIHAYQLLCPKSTLLQSSGNACFKRKLICRCYSKIKKILISKPDVVISPSRFALDVHKKNGFFNMSKHVVIPLMAEKNSLSIGNSATIQRQYFNIIFVGRLGKHKGVHILIEAFNAIAKNDMRLHIIGGGDIDYFKKLSNNNNKIIFYGNLKNEQALELYRHADITVFPSTCYENSPVVIYESLRAGKPVIGSNIGGVPELILDGYNGLLFEPGNIKHLGKLILKTYDNREYLKQLSDNAYESSKTFDMYTHIKKIEDIYKSVLS